MARPLKPSNRVVDPSFVAAALVVLVVLFAVPMHALAIASPSNFTGGVSSCSTNAMGVSLSWTDNSTNETYFSIWGWQGGQFLEEARAAPNATSVRFLDVPVAGGTVNRYWIYAYSTTEGYSTGIPLDITVPSAATVAPSNLAFSFPSANLLRLTWTDNSTQEAYYEVAARDVTGGANGSFVNLVTSGSSAYFGDIPWNMASADLFYFLHPGRTYEVKIQSVRYTGTFGSSPSASGYSNTVTVVVPGSINNTPSPVPTNITVAANVVSSTNRFGLYWDDNASDETGYEIQEKLGGSADTNYLSLGILSGVSGLNLGVGVGLANNYETNGARDFRVRTVRGQGPFAIFSAWSTPSGATMSSFGAPSNLVITAPADNGRIMVFWSDNATTETGYEFEYRVAGVGSFSSLGQLATTDYSRFQAGGGVAAFPPSTLVEFRIRAYSGANTTAYSNVASITMPPMTAPTSLAQGAAGAEGTLNLTWADNSGNELGYAVQIRRTLPAPADTGFSDALYTAASATSAQLTTQHMIPGYTYEIRVEAVNQLSQSSPIIYSNPSNILTRTSPFSAPTNLAVQSGSLNESSVTLTWTDNSSIEHGYFVYSRPSGSTAAPTLLGSVAAGTTSTTVGLTPGTSREFFVAAYVSLNPSGESVSSMSNALTVVAKDTMTSAIYLELRRNEAMANYTLTTTAGSTVSTRSITGLPAGLSFDSATGVLSGTPTGTGVTTCPVTVTFANGWTHTNSLAIRILQAPVANAFAAQTLTLGTPVTVPLADKFTDPDASSAARVTTNLSTNGGIMDIILFDAATPLHVANFMGYANRGDYTNSVFHRSIPGFVCQGGGYKPGANATSFTTVPKQAGVTNEPGISNIRSTVALAKLPNQPSSGTTEFFVNVNNNGPNLDFQNGGFTAFGRVTAPGMTVADAMVGLPSSTYSVTVDGSANSFADYPINDVSAPTTMDNTKSVKILSVTALPVLTYSITSNSNSGVVTASIVSGGLSLTAVAPGTSSIVVRATDLESRFVETTVSVTVAGNFSSWATAENLPSGQQGFDDDPDHDGMTNLLEYGLMTSPGTSTGSSTTLGSVPAGADNFATITFKVRKNAALTYTVQGTANLSAWSTVWTTPDGFAAATVVSAVDQGDHTLVTVKDTVAYGPGSPRSLRVRVTSP